MWYPKFWMCLLWDSSLLLYLVLELYLSFALVMETTYWPTSFAVLVELITVVLKL